MLKLSLKPGESLKIGEDVKVTIVLSTHQRIQLQIDAPRDVDIRRVKMDAPRIVIAGSRKCLTPNCSSERT